MLIVLLLVLPAISESADIVGRLVSPVVEAIALAMIGAAGLRAGAGAENPEAPEAP